MLNHQGDSMRKTFEVYGSWGTITVDVSGNVRAYDPECNIDKEYDGYSDILKFDVEEYIRIYGVLHDSIDIIHIGFITDTGEYVPRIEGHKS